MVTCVNFYGNFHLRWRRLHHRDILIFQLGTWSLWTIQRWRIINDNSIRNSITWWSIYSFTITLRRTTNPRFVFDVARSLGRNVNRPFIIDLVVARRHQVSIVVATSRFVRAGFAYLLISVDGGAANSLFHAYLTLSFNIAFKINVFAVFGVAIV